MIPPARTGILYPVDLDNAADNCSASRDNSASGEDIEMEEEGFKTKNPVPVFISTGSGRMEIFCWAAAQKIKVIKLKKHKLRFILEC
jgi:hypothetical protein